MGRGNACFMVLALLQKAGSVGGCSRPSPRCVVLEGCESDRPERGPVVIDKPHNLAASTKVHGLPDELLSDLDLHNYFNC